MDELEIEADGRLTLPPDYVARQGLEAGTRLVCDPIEEGLALRLARPDARRAYIEITARCNLDCATCVRQVWRDTPGEMDWEVFQAAIAGLRAFPDLKRLTFGGYGEPLSHPRFPEMLALAGELGADLTLTTNGLLLDAAMAQHLIEARLGTVIVSLDPMHVQAYERAGLQAGVDRVLDNLRTLREIGRERGGILPRIGLEFVLTRSSIEWLPRLSTLAREVGATIVLISNLLPHTPEQAAEILYDRGEALPASTGWPVLRGGFLLWGVASLPRMAWGAARRCRFVEEHALVVGWDGGVSPCYALMHSYPYYIYGRRKEVSRYVLGNVRERPLVDVWMSPEYVRFRAHVREMRFPSCVDCGLACSFAEENQDCWGNAPSCADCLWAQDIVRCP